MEIRVSAIDFQRLIPHHRLHAEFRLPVKLDERRFTLRIDEAKRVDAEPFHEAKRPRIVRSDMIQSAMCVLSGFSEMKSQKLSCAVCACGNPRSGSSLAAWMMSGNLIAS